MILSNSRAVFGLFGKARTTRTDHQNEITLGEAATELDLAKHETANLLVGTVHVTQTAQVVLNLNTWSKTSGTGTVELIDGNDFEGNPVVTTGIQALLVRVLKDSAGSAFFNAFDGGQVTLSPGEVFLMASPDELSNGNGLGSLQIGGLSGAVADVQIIAQVF